MCGQPFLYDRGIFVRGHLVMPGTNLPDNGSRRAPLRLVRIAGQVIGAFLLATTLALAQAAPAQPEALDLLKNVAETYRAMSTLRGDANMAMQMHSPDLEQKMEMPMTLSINAQGKMRMESKGDVPMVTVADGQTLWVYMPLFNRYMKIPLGQAGAYGRAGFTVPRDYLNQFSKVAENVKQATVVGSETLRANGAEVSCWIVSVEYEPPASDENAAPGGAAGPPKRSGTTKLWVEKTHYLVYRQSSDVKVERPGTSAASELKNTLTFTSLAVDEPIPDETFVFKPPAGATEMDPSSFMPQSPAPKRD